jgi:hypothetical protein
VRMGRSEALLAELSALHAGALANHFA